MYKVLILICITFFCGGCALIIPGGAVVRFLLLTI
ncbi:hypothetical protein UABAM_01630 [Candidatus Uabimicrobium amorphum]|uniref:Uncharacterized protein n=1 Tax=Uabimicrobium amorphum TaxID=2596890 RepID=A0A5S9IJZ8_UABAM|nr:hypothetical protein UABAM_01630 [Candidatus Uabimicrobium amorphum]